LIAPHLPKKAGDWDGVAKEINLGKCINVALSRGRGLKPSNRIRQGAGRKNA
jgi:hypothetical protein